MKKTPLIIGLIFIALTAGIFVYLTFFKVAAPTASPITISGEGVTSARFEEPVTTLVSDTQNSATTQTSEETAIELEPNPEPEPSLPMSRFTQLTTEPVVGMTFIGTTTARYLTRGTATIKDISLISGEVISSVDTNMTDIIDASFSNDGDTLLITFIDNTTRRYFTGTIQTHTSRGKSFQGSLLPENTIDAAFSGKNNIIRYTLKTALGGEVHTFTQSTKTDTISTTLPYSNTILAASILTDTYYTYPSPASEFIGSVHDQKNNSYITSGGRGLTAYNFGGGVLTTKYTTDSHIISSAVIEGKEHGIPATLKTDACTTNITSETILTCGTSFSWDSHVKYPDDWYKGTYRFDDKIVSIDIESRSVITVGNPLKETGVSFDILKMYTHPTIQDTYLLINKNNGYLWMFRNL